MTEHAFNKGGGTRCDRYDHSFRAGHCLPPQRAPYYRQIIIICMLLDNSVRNRVVEMKLVRGRDLLGNDGNWRLHPAFQQEALQGILGDVGVADALKAYYSARNGGRLTLVDGHLRKDTQPDLEWPVIILDIDDAEADKLLATYDAIGAWAATDARQLDKLLQSVSTDDSRMEGALARMRKEIADQVNVLDALEDEDGEEAPSEVLRKRLSKSRENSVKVVIAVDDLGTVEQAIKRVGIRNRGEALVAICRYFLDSVIEP